MAQPKTDTPEAPKKERKPRRPARYASFKDESRASMAGHDLALIADQVPGLSDMLALCPSSALHRVADTLVTRFGLDELERRIEEARKKNGAAAGPPQTKAEKKETETK